METLIESEVKLLIGKMKSFPVSVPLLFNWYVFYLHIGRSNKLEAVKRIKRELGCGLREAKDLFEDQLAPWFETMREQELKYLNTEF